MEVIMPNHGYGLVGAILGLMTFIMVLIIFLRVTGIV